MTSSKHPHTIVRHALVALITGQTSVGDKVRASRKNPWGQTEVPDGGILIYTRKSRIDPGSTKGQQTQYLRGIDVFVLMGIGVREDATTSADDAVDALARQVEVLILNNESLGLETNADAQAIGLLPSECVPVDVDTDMDESGRMPIAFAQLQYRVSVFDRMLDANTGPLDTFATAGVKTNLGGVQAPAEETDDVVEIPTT